MIPNTKHTVPLSFWGRVKNATVFFGPMMSTKPITKRMFPRASKLESKNASTPKMKKSTPAAVKPTPNSAER